MAKNQTKKSAICNVYYINNIIYNIPQRGVMVGIYVANMASSVCLVC